MTAEKHDSFSVKVTRFFFSSIWNWGVGSIRFTVCARTFVPHARRGSGGRVKPPGSEDFPTHPPWKWKNLDEINWNKPSQKTQTNQTTQTCKPLKASAHTKHVAWGLFDCLFVSCFFCPFNPNRYQVKEDRVRIAKRRHAEHARDAGREGQEEEGSGFPPMNRVK